jgi:hypothetical protein
MQLTYAADFTPRPVFDGQHLLYSSRQLPCELSYFPLPSELVAQRLSIEGVCVPQLMTPFSLARSSYKIQPRMPFTLALAVHTLLPSALEFDFASLR